MAHATSKDLLLKEAEQAIQRILLDLDERLAEVGDKIDSVRVDTRNFANLAVEIITTL